MSEVDVVAEDVPVSAATQLLETDVLVAETVVIPEPAPEWTAEAAVAVSEPELDAANDTVNDAVNDDFAAAPAIVPEFAALAEQVSVAIPEPVDTPAPKFVPVVVLSETLEAAPVSADVIVPAHEVAPESTVVVAEAAAAPGTSSRARDCAKRDHGGRYRRIGHRSGDRSSLRNCRRAGTRHR